MNLTTRSADRRLCLHQCIGCSLSLDPAGMDGNDEHGSTPHVFYTPLLHQVFAVSMLRGGLQCLTESMLAHAGTSVSQVPSLCWLCSMCCTDISDICSMLLLVISLSKPTYGNTSVLTCDCTPCSPACTACTATLCVRAPYRLYRSSSPQLEATNVTFVTIDFELEQFTYWAMLLTSPSAYVRSVASVLGQRASSLLITDFQLQKYITARCVTCA